MSEELKYVNLSYLEGIADGDKDIIKELVEIFIDQIPEFKDGFAIGLLEKDWLKIAAIAHKAKSSVVSMGMKELGNKDLKNLELLAKQLRIIDLNLKDDVTESQKVELVDLERNFEGYPEDRVEWVRNNANTKVLDQLINKFNVICVKAIFELNNVINTY